MRIASAQVKLYAPWVHSLKEKRMEVKSLIAKVQNKFHISIAEVDENDIYQIIVLGIASVAGSTAQGGQYSRPCAAVYRRKHRGGDYRRSAGSEIES